MAKNPYLEFAPTSEAGASASVNPYLEFAPTPSLGKRSLAGDVAANWDPSAKKFARGLAQAIIHPVESVKTIGLAGLGAVEIIIPGAKKRVAEISPETAQRAMDTANAVGGMFKEMYGSLEAIENTLRTDPVEFSADISTLLTGGAGLMRLGAKAVP